LNLLFFTSLFPLKPGELVAVIGGGGKTSLLAVMEAELTEAGLRSITTVTTRLGRGQLPALEPIEAASLAEAQAAVRRAAAGERILLSGPPPPEDDGRPLGLRGVPAQWFPALRAESPLIWLVEADGSAGLPVKAHRADEPVLPPPPRRLVLVLGLTALVKPWTEAIHRPELFRLLQPTPESGRPLTPREIASFASAAWPPLAPDLVLLNQLDAVPEELAPAARELGALLAEAGFRVVAGSLRSRTFAEMG
jgi:probable selenium-dependent hydroxylase accessory protein YqeC